MMREVKKYRKRKGNKKSNEYISVILEFEDTFANFYYKKIKDKH